MSVSPKPVKRPAKLRSAITNSPHKLAGYDMRTVRGRRYVDIVEALIEDFGEGEPDRLREIACLRLSLEDAQAEVLSGESKARDDMVRISNLLTRRETDLRVKLRKKPKPEGVKAYLARQGAAAQ